MIPVYDKTNRYISFGTDLKLRREGLDMLLKSLERDQFSIVDLGCGPGNMTQMLSGKGQSTLADALPSMMQVAKSRNPASEGVLSVYESLPFRRGSFDSAMTGFAIRDARNLSEALREVNSILKENGFFLIVDLCKPDSRVKRALLGAYWRFIAPLVALSVSGRKGLKFAALFTTYKRLPTNTKFADLIKSSGFEICQREYRMLDGACIMLLKKV